MIKTYYWGELPNWSSRRLHYNPEATPRPEKAMVVIGKCADKNCPHKENDYTHDTVDRKPYRYPFPNRPTATLAVINQGLADEILLKKDKLTVFRTNY
jgi:hypothetical protein